VSAYGCSSSASTRSGGTFDVAALERQAAELSDRASAPDFWNDAERAQVVSRETSQVLAVISRWKARREAADELEVLLELVVEGEGDALAELGTKLPVVEADLAQAELERLLGGEHDAGNAIVEIHPAPAASRRRTGPRCCSACTSAGASAAATPPSWSSSRRGRGRASRAPPSR
jgi:hypothetical protein